MANIWFWSDPHFGHKNCLNFTLADGSKMRPFGSVEEMDETMIANHNALVKPPDKVYCLGDFCMDEREKWIVHYADRLNGHGRLVRGNHDMGKTKAYLKSYFEEIYATRLIKIDDSLRLLLSHIPVHGESLRPEWTNVHGHVHNNVAPLHFGPNYLNICVEMTAYRPLALEEVVQRARKQREVLHP